MRIREGDIVPKFYGISHFDHCHGFAYCYPVPINLIVRWVRSVWVYLKNPEFFAKPVMPQAATQFVREHCRSMVDTQQITAVNAGSTPANEQEGASCRKDSDFEKIKLENETLMDLLLERQNVQNNNHQDG